LRQSRRQVQAVAGTEFNLDQRGNVRANLAD
jgi:hypothetical protein